MPCESRTQRKAALAEVKAGLTELRAELKTDLAEMKARLYCHLWVMAVGLTVSLTFALVKLTP